MKKRLAHLLPLLFCLAGADTLAQDPGSGNIYFDLMPVIAREDEDRSIDNPGYGARASLGFGLGGPWHIEGQLFGIRANGEGAFSDSNAYTTGLGIDAVYAFGDRRSYTPFLLAGAGVSNNNGFPGSSDTNGFLNLGGGIVTGLLGNSGVRLRAEIRYLRDYFSTDMNDWHLGVGISVPFGQPAPPPAPPVVVAPPPEPEPEPEPQPPEPVRTLVLEDVHFEFNSATLTHAARNSLDQTARELNSQPKGRVEVAGHTDSRGKAAYNQRLSEQRASSVRQYLISKGVPAERLSSRGYGQDQPIDSNDTDAGRARNRRVELRFFE